jgi:hypothetical protein
MSKSNIFEGDLLKLIFQNQNIATLGDATGVRGSASGGNIYISLHTADPGEGGDQTSFEVGLGAYAQYIRVAIARGTGTWSVSSNLAENLIAITFPTLTTGTGATVTHFGIGVSVNGVGKLLYSGALQVPLVLTNGITPTFPIGDLNVTED